MFRPTLIRSKLLRPLSRPILPYPQRLASTHAPTNSSGPPSGEISTRLAPGEEIDPQLNGYPQLPYVSLQRRPALGWWNVQERKNFGETVHEEDELLGMWGPDDHKMSGATALGQLGVAMAIMGTFAYLVVRAAPDSPATPRSFPYGGLEAELGGRNAARPEKEDEDE